MAVQGNTKTVTIEDILRKNYVGQDGKVNEDAVNAGLYILSVYETWDAISRQMDEPEILDAMVMMVFNGEANLIVPMINDLSDKIKDMELAKDLLKFLGSIMSGEASNNAFIRQHREFLIGPMMESGQTEIARRRLSGKAKKAADSNRWQVLSSIASKCAGAGRGVDMSMNLREAFTVKKKDAK